MDCQVEMEKEEEVKTIKVYKAVRECVQCVKPKKEKKEKVEEKKKEVEEKKKEKVEDKKKEKKDDEESDEEKDEENEKVDDEDYSGCFYTVGFKTDKPIFIRGLEFYGPSKATATYVVVSRIQRFVEDWSGFSGLFGFLWPWGPYYKVEELMETCRTGVSRAKKGEKFIVELPYPVYVEAEKWTDIKFELVGPKTRRITRMINRDRVILDNYSVVNFEFLHGSRQLSAIYFSVE